MNTATCLTRFTMIAATLAAAVTVTGKRAAAAVPTVVAQKTLKAASPV